jgi:uncharacterized small protein (DUF1192 family)
MEKIAKYRDERLGNDYWILTNFTMTQVERRLAILEEEIKRLRKRA